MGIYKIKSVSSGKCINIYGNNVADLENRRRISLWEDTNSLEQRWKIENLGSNVNVKSIIDDEYGLILKCLDAPCECEINKISENEANAKINFIKVGNYYKIQLKNYNYLYLTAAGTANGSDVYWNMNSNSNNQLWIVEDIPTSKELYMPQNLNQKYSNNEQHIITYGCAVCSAGDVASYYGNKAYTLQELKNAGVYTSTDASCNWIYTPYAGFTHVYDSTGYDYLAIIKSEIAANRPVIVHCYKDNAPPENASHYVVAYKYTNNAENESNIFVLDPTGSPNSTVGELRTLKDSRDTNDKDRVIGVKLTYAK